MFTALTNKEYLVDFEDVVRVRICEEYPTADGLLENQITLEGMDTIEVLMIAMQLAAVACENNECLKMIHTWRSAMGEKTFISQN